MPHNHIQEASGIMSISIFQTAAILACVASEVSACWGLSSYCRYPWSSTRDVYNKLERTVKSNKDYILWATRSGDANKEFARQLANENKKLMTAMAELSRISMQEQGYFYGQPDNKPKKDKTSDDPAGPVIKNPNYRKYEEITFKNPADTKAVIKAFETIGREPNLKMYNAKSEGMETDPTIGYGFSLKRQDAAAIFNDLLSIPAEDFKKIKAGEKSITKENAEKLFNNDIDTIYIPRAKKRLGAGVFDKLPPNVKTAVVNAIYRGDLGQKAVGYMKNNEWNKVSTEYLDHKGYQNASNNKMNGIVQRMNWNAKQFDSMIKKDK